MPRRRGRPTQRHTGCAAATDAGSAPLSSSSRALSSSGSRVGGGPPSRSRWVSGLSRRQVCRAQDDEPRRRHRNAELLLVAAAQGYRDGHAAVVGAAVELQPRARDAVVAQLQSAPFGLHGNGAGREVRSKTSDSSWAPRPRSGLVRPVFPSYDTTSPPTSSGCPATSPPGRGRSWPAVPDR